jgi:two-component system, sensor histidine kinase and response regulator
MARVLIVEDSKIFSNLLSKKIKSLEHTVLVATTFREAQALIENNSFDVAVVDLTLPDASDGEIVGHVSGAKIPSIVFTGSFDPEIRAKVMAQDVFDYLLKESPDAPEAVVRSIQRLFRNQQTTILVVDDSLTSRTHIRKLLQRFRFTIIEAADSYKALESLKKHPEISMVITDYNMPGMDGFELVSRIRKTYPMEKLAIIGISSERESILSAKFLKKGANDFLVKPFFQEEFYNRIILNIETIEHFAEIRAQSETLSELNKQKNKFLGIAAHDLRNPLASIRGFSEIMLGESTGPLTEEQNEFLTHINNLSNQMLQLVNDLLDVAAIESGKLDLNVKCASLLRILEDRIRINRVLADKKGITLAADLSPLAEFSFDPNRLIQVIDNLVSNAVKFSNPGTTVTITLSEKLSKKGSLAMVSVRDQGPGISAEDREKLFGEFQKLSARPTAGEGSTGLGLNIAKKIIEAHKGSIWVESVPGQGATFFFTLPMGEN